jgi:hypothetical protein
MLGATNLTPTGQPNLENRMVAFTLAGFRRI